MICNLWEALVGVRSWSFRSGLRSQKKLRAPVVSVGNITFGGTGKTPFTIWLAGKLINHGYQVSILIRGYRRQSTGVKTYLPDNHQTNASITAVDGDEPQLYRRHLPHVALGIADRRYDAGCAVELKSPVDVHLLDDGFQHLFLRRDCDIVLVDATNPWGARNGLPRALRESRTALRRADAIVLTRCEQSGPASLTALESDLRAIKPDAALFRSHTELTGLRASLDTPAIQRSDLRGKSAVAVCGIGNPDGFYALLRAAGLTLVATRTFPDHHRYNDQDVDQINDLIRSHSAEVLITTEKDVVNLPHPERFAENFIAPAYWAEISISIAKEDSLLDKIVQKIGRPGAGSGRN
jgi:tetraacyldisaccharide 4'-kinase